VWGEDQAVNPANALQAVVSQLRRLLGREVVVRQGVGYRLSLPPDAVDAIALEQLVQSGRTAAADGDHRLAADRYRAAVSLVRGAPLGELADRWFVREAGAGSRSWCWPPTRAWPTASWPSGTTPTCCQRWAI
jgi:hypothetical protein